MATNLSDGPSPFSLYKRSQIDSMGPGEEPAMRNPVVQSGYLDALLKGVQAGQDRRKKQRELASQALQQNSQGGVGGGGGYSNPATPGDWGDPIGDPGFAQKYLTTIRLPNGQSILVHKNIAQQASGFLTELWNSGYKFGDVQTYNKRKVQTPKGQGNSWSRHSTGLAMDIDPGRNPWGGRYALPQNAGQLAAKYGLSWLGPKNGDWMHFGYTAPQWQGIAGN